MRKLYSIFLVIVLTASLFAQSPQKMSYQAVIRNSSNVLVTSSPVGMRISVLQGSATGTPVYVETQTPTTNANGLVTIEIGGGTPVTGTFAVIDWSAGPYFIKTETDPAGGTNYTVTGTSQLLSVPYALYAKTVAGYPETDPVFIAHPANGITGTSITNWNSAFGWGNHANAGYLISFTETDTLIWKKKSGNIYYNSGNVGIGTALPSNALSVFGSANFSTSVLSPMFQPLTGEGTTLTIMTNNVSSNTNVGDMLIKGGNNNGPNNSSGRAGDISIVGGTFNVPNPTNPATSRAGNINIAGGASPTGGGIVGVGGNVTLTGGTVGNNGDHGNGGAVILTAGAGNQGGNISITAGTGVGAGKVYIQGGTSTTVPSPGNVIISGGDKTGGMYGSIIFNTATVQQAVIDHFGNFGIGTPTPATKLDISGVITATGGNSTNWNTAFGWGNHASAGYLTSFAETDPKIGTNISGYTPKWDGTALITGAIYQDASGNVGIGTTSPGAKLEVNGDIISANRAYGMVYRSSAYDIPVENLWFDIPLNGGNANLVNVAHSTITNPERVTVNVSGTYLMQYTVHFRRQGAPHHGVARLYKNSASEIMGSFTIASPTSGDANEDSPLIGHVIMTLSANDYVTIQVSTNTNVTNEIDVYSGPDLPNPATRIYSLLTITKIGP